MNDALSRTNAWVNRAGVVLDPSPVFGGQTQPGSSSPNDHEGRTEDGKQFTIPSELATAIMQMDASADQAEHQQAKEQARLLQRFQQLKQWQHQQQERLMRQQQEQLQNLRLEQQRVEQTLVAQRQKQWGGIQQIQQSPPRIRTAPHPQRSLAASPHRSTLPDALAQASIALSQTAGPPVTNPLLKNVEKDTQGPEILRRDMDLASDSASSVIEEGVYPLPETASEMSFGVIEEEEEKEATPSDAQDKTERQEEEDERGTDNSLDESLQDAAALNHKMSESVEPPPSQQLVGDDRPIQSALGSKAKTFEELLELHLRNEAEKYQSSENPAQQALKDSPRRTFLRKGTGTARFGVVTKKPPKPPSPRPTQAPAVPGPKPAPSKTIPTTTTGGSKNSTSGAIHKPSPAAMSKLSLVKTERKDSTKEDDRRKPEKQRRGKKEEAPQMARKVATKPPVATKPSQDPLSKQILPSTQLRQAPSLEYPAPGQLRAPPAPAVVVGMVVGSQDERAHGQQLTTEGALPDDTIEMSFQMRMKEWELNHKVEQEELDEFELLEEAADDNASFASDASVVVNMMQRVNERKKRTDEIPANTLQVPSKSVPIQRRQKSTSAAKKESGPTQAQDQSPDESPDQSPDQSQDFTEGDSFFAGDQTLTGDNENSPELNFRGVSRESGENRHKAGSSTEEDLDDAAQDVLPMSQRQASLGETRRSLQDSTGKREENIPNSLTDEDDQVGGGEDENLHAEIEDASEDDAGKPSRIMKRKAATSSHAVDVDFDDDESWGDFGEAGSESFDDNEDDDEDDIEEEDDASVILAGAPSATSTPPPPTFMKGHKSVLDRRKESTRETNQSDALASPPTSSLVSKLFPKLKPTQNTSQPRQEKVKAAQPPAKSPETTTAEGLQSKLLKEKLVELEAEISKFRRENAALAKLREEREKGLAALDKEVVDFQKMKAEELKNLQDYKEEEMKKLRKEKRTFEKYQKAARALPDKKDREEIELLKKQLSDLQEEMSRRETRWTAASSRLRDRTDILEQENAELREEVRLLEQQRLQAWKREEEKLKSSLAKPKQTVPVVNKQKLPPLSLMTDPEPQPDPKQTADPKRETVREKPKVTTAMTRPQVPNSKPENVAVEPRTVDSSTEEDVPLTAQPRRQSQKKRSVRFDVESSPRKHPSTATATTSTATAATAATAAAAATRAEESLDLFSPSREEGGYEYSSPKGGAPGSGGRESREWNRSMNNNNDDNEEIHHPDGKIEEIRSDGSRVITYGNQTRKEISADGQSVIVTFFNGDIKQIMPDQRVMYYYAETQTTHTTYPDGLEVIKFNNNQTEKHYPNGTKEITFPDQTIKYLFPNGNEESIFPDGTVLRAEKNGNRTMEFPNGQREVHTAQYKRREFPDGTVKTVFPDGRQETRYSTGRIRVKDKEGRVILDKK